MRIPTYVVLVFSAVWLPAQTSAPFPTAVYTLDVKHNEISETPDNPIDAQYERWAGGCEIVPAETVPTLRCPEPAPADRGARPGEDRESVRVVVGLFRDLDETLYVAGCPLLDDLKSRKERPESDQARREGGEQQASECTTETTEDAERNCQEISVGQTFTTEVEGPVMRIVFRGEQLALTLFDRRPKERTISSPYEPRPTRTKPSITAGPPSEAMGIPPERPPEFLPPDLSAVTSTIPSPAAGEGVPLAETSLRTGRVVVACQSGPARVYIDDTYLGLCPVDLPMIAGRHTIRVQWRGGAEWAHEFSIEAGQSLRLRAIRSSSSENEP